MFEFCLRRKRINDGLILFILDFKRVKKTRIKENSYVRLKHKIFVFSFQCYRLVIWHGSLGSFDISLRSNAWTHQSGWENKQTWAESYMLSSFKWTPTSFESVRYFCNSAKKFFFFWTCQSRSMKHGNLERNLMQQNSNTARSTDINLWTNGI